MLVAFLIFAISKAKSSVMLPFSNRESFDYQGINSVDELKQEWHQYKSLHARAISGFFKGLSKLDNRLYSTEKLSEHLIKSCILKLSL
jgi:hypothetical protein